jgi:hypothetical protein
MNKTCSFKLVNNQIISAARGVGFIAALRASMKPTPRAVTTASWIEKRKNDVVIKNNELFEKNSRVLTSELYQNYTAILYQNKTATDSP